MQGGYKLRTVEEKAPFPGGDESDNSYTINRSMARLDIPRSNSHLQVIS